MSHRGGHYWLVFTNYEADIHCKYGKVVWPSAMPTAMSTRSEKKKMQASTSEYLQQKSIPGIYMLQCSTRYNTIFYKNIRSTSAVREFDNFRVDTHPCKLRDITRQIHPHVYVPRSKRYCSAEHIRAPDQAEQI